jgi:stearoyl-CoA 9-desaturase NADPH oxidoreductase
LTPPIALATLGEQMFTDLASRALLLAPSGPARGRAPVARRLARRVAGSGLLEALTAPHGVDRYLELVLPSLSLHDPRAEIVGVARPTARSLMLRLRPNEVWRGFRAGQFVSMTVEIDGVRRTRCYSPASSQHASDGELELTVRTHSKGLVSRHLREHAHPGMVVELAQADGDFVLPETRPEHLLLISGGSGITPVLSILRTLCDEGHEAPVTFLHYARHERELTHRRELDELARRHRNVRVAYAHTRDGAGRLRGHLTRTQLRAVDRRYREAETYVCGPPGLVEATRTLWRADGQEQRLHSESFLPPSIVPMAADAGGSVRFAASGIEVPAAPMTLLAQAERAGLTPVYGCRMGICHTCTCRKLAGAVRNINTGQLSSQEEEDIQICVSVPAGDVALDL